MSTKPRLRRRALGLVGGVVLTTGGLAAGGAAGPARSELAASTQPAPVCGASVCTVAYSTPGTGQSFTVPAGVSSLGVTLVGAAGGAGDGGTPGGDGAKVTATAAVAGGEALEVTVGGEGQSGPAGGRGGVGYGGAGGTEGSVSQTGGGGGGESGIGAVNGTSIVWAVAAGGGGGGGAAGGESCGDASESGGPGGNAGSPGSPGQSSSMGGGGAGGGAGTLEGTGAGGSGGSGGNWCDGSGASGRSGVESDGGVGGAPLSEAGGGGGGGGGFFGGGGGGAGSETAGEGAGGGGGGGGSSGRLGTAVSDFTVVSDDAGTGNGSVTIAYADPLRFTDVASSTYTTHTDEDSTLEIPVSSLEAGVIAPSGDTLSVKVVGRPEHGTVVDPSGDLAYTPDPGFFGTDSFTYEVLDPYGDYVTGRAEIDVAQALHVISVSSVPPSGSGSSPTFPVATPPPPEPVAVGETCGAGGTVVQLWGENLAGSTVRFANATSGVVTMLSGTEAEVSVPHGVDGIGPVTVVGPGGQAVAVPHVTWDPACGTETLEWSSPAGPGQVSLHVEVVGGNGKCLSSKTVVVLGRDGEQVAKLTTTDAPSVVTLPISEGPFQAVFDGDAHCGASESGLVG